MTVESPPGVNNQASSFDQFAPSYDAALQRGLSVSGESCNYFAEQRVLWFRKRLQTRELAPPKS